MTDEKTTQEEFKISADKVVEKIKMLLKEGNVRRITIKNEEGVVLIVIPLTIAIIGTVLAPILAAVGALAALLTNCTIVVERRV
ncbi:MAG: DUF4342 domain-containing protein [Candidatus Andersenbacteria bacterium]|nr:DUF4342 domain-containing protein [Candidatus Andersenbacteria bacterium]MBI3250854.1 DUF4342 domain-containing protein [Candidatus Andersenbacteria bacterium]